MNHFKYVSAILATFFSSFLIRAQVSDTLIDVGNYQLHFHIVKGKGIPILFESGLGDAGSVWDTILKPLQRVTGTTLITYDRSGYGTSDANSKETDDSKHGIMEGMKALEKALKILGFDEKIILVCHSYGGFYTTLYASRHPEKVKYVIRLDASLADFYTDDLLQQLLLDETEKGEIPGTYYERKNFRNTVKIMRSISFPSTIPAIDITAGIQFQYAKEWNQSHVDFVNAQPNRKGIIAYGSEHNIIRDNPSLVIQAIIKAYIELQKEPEQCNLLYRAFDNAIELSNETRKNTKEYLSSETSLNDLGYTFIENRNIEKALEVFRLNVLLFPESWNVYDSYGEALLLANKKREGIEMYKKSLELNPDNQNAKAILKKLK